MNEAPLGCPLLDYLRSCAEAFFLGLRVKCLPSVTAESIRCSARPRRDSDGLQLHTGTVRAGAVGWGRRRSGEQKLLSVTEGSGDCMTQSQLERWSWQVKRQLEGSSPPLVCKSPECLSRELQTLPHLPLQVTGC